MNETSQKADLIVKGIDWLITVDPDRRIIRDAAIAVVNGEFAAIENRPTSLLPGTPRILLMGLVWLEHQAS